MTGEATPAPVAGQSANRRVGKRPETSTSPAPKPSTSRSNHHSSAARRKNHKPPAHDDKATLRWLTWSLEKMKAKRESDRKSLAPCLTTCTSVTKFAVVYACVLLLRSILGRCFEGMLHNLEKLYMIKWTELEFILGVEKIGFAITFLLIGYYGNGIHKPLAVMCGAFLCSMGSFVCTIPNFVNNSTMFNETIINTDYFEAGLCFTGRNVSTSTLSYQYQCDAHDARALASDVDVFSIICLGYFAVGIGTSLFATLGIVYIEENGEKKDNILIYGLLLSLYGLGDLLGSLVIWACSLIPHQITGTLYIREIQAEAWWLPPLVLGCLFLLPAFFLLPFPRWIKEPSWLVKRRERRYTKYQKLIEGELKRLDNKRRKRKRKERRARIRKQQAEAKANREREEKHKKEKAVSDFQDVASGTEGATNPTFQGDIDTNATDAESQSKVNNSPTPPNDIASANDVIGITKQLGEESDNQSDGSSAESDVEDNSSKQNGALASNQSLASQNGSISNSLNNVGPEIEVLGTGEAGVSDVKEKRKVGFEEGPDEEHTYEVESNAESIIKKEQAEKRKDMLGRQLRDLPKHMKYLMRRPVYTLALLGTLLFAYHPGGYRPSLPHYTLTAFPSPEQPNGHSLVGITHGLAVTIGALVGGIVVYTRGFSLLQQFTLLSASVSAHILLTVFLMPLGCSTELFGLSNNTDSFDLNVKCNEQCDCTGVQYEPVCSIEGVQFPSPCHAGCPHILSDPSYLVRDHLLFVDCLCVPDRIVSRGYCDLSCAQSNVFYFILFLASLAHSLGYITLLLVFLRSVPEKLRSISIALAGWLPYIFGIVPGKAVFGYITDTSCKHKEDDCYEEKRCWFYEQDVYRYLIHGADMCFQLGAAVFFILTALAMRSKTYAATRIDTEKGANGAPSQFDNIGFSGDDKENGSEREGAKSGTNLDPHADSGESKL